MDLFRLQKFFRVDGDLFRAQFRVKTAIYSSMIAGPRFYRKGRSRTSVVFAAVVVLYVGVARGLFCLYEF